MSSKLKKVKFVDLRFTNISHQQCSKLCSYNNNNGICVYIKTMGNVIIYKRMSKCVWSISLKH